MAEPWKNKYHEQSTYQEMDGSNWEKCWQEGRIFFHRAETNVMLVNYYERAFCKEECTKIFIPFCGKSLDMIWFYQKGHTVYGVEVAELAVVQFFKENAIEYSVQERDNIQGKIYQSNDNKIYIFCCDLFVLNRDMLGTFDGIYDRGSLSAVNHSDRKRYAELMISLMGPRCNYMLITYDYDPEKDIGPPHAVSMSVLEELYGHNCIIDTVHSEEAITEMKKAQNHEYFIANCFILTPKS